MSALFLHALIILAVFMLVQAIRVQGKDPTTKIHQSISVPLTTSPQNAISIRDSFESRSISIRRHGRYVEEAPVRVNLPFIDADQPVPLSWEFYSVCHDYKAILGDDIDRSSVSGMTNQLNNVIDDRTTQLKLPELRRQVVCLYLQSGLASQQSVQAKNETSVHSVLNHTSMQQTMLKYFERYVHEAKRRQYIFHHHISKNSGTAICNAMRNSGCRVTEKNTSLPIHGVNCWAAKFHDKYMWTKTTRPGSNEQYSCNARLDFVKSTRLSVMSNENYLTDDVGNASCSHHGSLSLNVVRDPLKRMLSHETEFVTMIIGKKCMKNRSIECFWATEHGNFVSKNFQTKALAGKSAWTAPEVTEEHYQQAIANLKSFDVLLTIGRNPSSYAVPWATMFRVGLGLFRVKTVSGRARSNKLKLSPSQLDYFHHNNRWDYALFDYARMLERLDMIGYNRTATLCRQPVMRTLAPTACAAFLNEAATLQSLSSLPLVCGWPRRTRPS